MLVEDELQLEDNADELQLEDNADELQLEDNADELQLEDNADELQLEDNVDELQLDHAAPCLEDNKATLEDNEVAHDNAMDTSVTVLKERGNRAFKAGNLQEAKDAYSEALAGCAGRFNAERSTLLTNRAACSLKLSDWAGAINDCTAALSVAAATPETRTKALFRRATAFLESGDNEGARRDVEQLPPSAATVQRLLARLKATADSASGRDGLPGASALADSSAPAHRKRVSCISPTTPERHLFHEVALYRCFNAQTHHDLELIVVDTGTVPSPFFTSPSFSDDRVTYLYQRQHQTIGEKRNLAIQHATGDIICHFDDDDLYAPEYIATMVAAMEEQEADFVKLSAWLVHDLQTDVTGLFDADTPMPHPSLAVLREQFLYTYGFSFLYRRALFPTFSFLDTSWGEDQDILRRVREANKKLALHRDLKGICLHNQHGENCSRSFAHIPVAQRLLVASPIGHLLDALPVIGQALARRGHNVDGGAYVMNQEQVVVRSDVVGGLFVWAHEVERHQGDAGATVEAFTHWLWSGNGFSKERYAKLGLNRPRPPESLLKKVAAEQHASTAQKELGLAAGTTYGLESLRTFEGMALPHAPGAIVNPAAYRDPAKKSAVPKFAAGGSGFGNPTRAFVP